jgi:hypothetical protein
MHTTNVHAISRPIASHTVVTLPVIDRQKTSNVFYRALGMALASSVSAVFWVAILTVILPAWNVMPSTQSLVLTGVGIAFVVSAALLALANCTY